MSSRSRVRALSARLPFGIGTVVFALCAALVVTGGVVLASGTAQTDDAVVLTEDDERFWLGAGLSADERWLFPGKSAGRPRHPSSLMRSLNRQGIPVRQAEVRHIR